MKKFWYWGIFWAGVTLIPGLLAIGGIRYSHENYDIHIQSIVELEGLYAFIAGFGLCKWIQVCMRWYRAGNLSRYLPWL